MTMTNRKWLRDMSQYDMLMFMNKCLTEETRYFECIMDALGERKLGVECYCKCDECIAKWLNEEHGQGVTT